MPIQTIVRRARALLGQGILPFCICMLLTGSAGCEGRSMAPPDGFLEGTVTIGPLCPVEPCTLSSDQVETAYAARKVIVFTPDRTRTVKEKTLDHTGKYRFELEPGGYLVDINHTGIDHSADVPRSITIASNSTVTVNIDIDTGIR